MRKICQNLSMTVLTVSLFCPSVLAQESNIFEQNIINNSPAETAQSNIIEITNIEVIPTEEGINVFLQTNEQLSAPEITITENALIADISDVMLKLATGDEFLVSNPVKGIALVNVISLPDNRVRVTITGTNSPPLVDIKTSPLETILTTKLGTSATQEEQEKIEIIATGEAPQENNYFVPDASTATRTDTPILDTPQSIQVVPQEVLRDQQVIRVDEALRNVSNVIGRLSPFGASTSLTIRGFTSDNFTGGPILRDGFRVNDNLGTQETANVERVEVLKGPSSVLYGQNDPGGIINLVTKRPLFEPFYEVGLQVGSYTLIRPTIDISGPLTEDKSLRYRLNVAYLNDDGFRDFNVNTKRFFIAPVVSWDISDKTNFSVVLEYNNEESPFDLGIPARGNGVFDVPSNRVVGELDDSLRNKSFTLGYDFQHQFNDDWTFNHGFRYVNQNYNVFPLLPFSVDEKTGDITLFFADRSYHSDDYSIQTNVVGNFNTGSVEHTLLAGLDLNFNRFDEQYTRISRATPVILNIFNPVYGTVPRPDLSSVQPFPPFDTQYDRYGVFLQDQVNFSDKFILVGSIRYDIVDYRLDETYATLYGTNPTRNDSKWSPRVGFIYKPIETVSIYGNYSQSFKPNFGADINGNSFEPETAGGFEVGVKAEFLEGKMFTTLAYFDITKQNVVTADPTNPLFSVVSGEQRSQGFEFDIAGEILPGWRIIANYAYTDAKVTEDNTIPVGNRLFNAPYNSAGLWTTYEFQKGDLQGLGFGLGFNYVGDRYGDLANSYTVGDYFITNMAVFYNREDWRIALNVNNLFDTNYIISTFNSRNYGNAFGQPLTIIGSVSIKF
ncbi:TonB-dependent siderophore receptor [Geminocystis sp. GBBB08]|uniref:TonB-dependent siderophore receptor n=1 Tax=Geminocystis sp. GBBB08 TaxID=2604140 RepID=UPI0027E2B6B6|nr:TonB-dependent siderophore receptor [Geminocystis sp. GBBB08]MBL1210202.1 TonB-dependent siderophore receptor [Geminocystis sp. GBBB08]